MRLFSLSKVVQLVSGQLTFEPLLSESIGCPHTRFWKMSLQYHPLLYVPFLSLFHIYCAKDWSIGPEFLRPFYTMRHGMTQLGEGLLGYRALSLATFVEAGGYI